MALHSLHNLLTQLRCLLRPVGIIHSWAILRCRHIARPVGFGYSVVLNNVETASSILERWCKNLVVAPVWNGELLSFVPYWSQPINNNPGWDSGNGIGKKYFSPCPTAVVTIPLDQILQSDAKEDDPIAFMRKDPIEVYNTIRVDFKDRTNFFNDVPAEAKD